MMKQSRGRLVGALLLAGCLLILFGCSRAKPKVSQVLPDDSPVGPTSTVGATADVAPTADATPTEAVAAEDSPPVFRLQAPIGSAPEQTFGPAFSVTIENCDSSDVLVQEHSETMYVASSLTLDPPPDDLDAHTADIERMVRDAYGIDQENGYDVTVLLPIEVAGDHRATVQLRWNTTWDENIVEVVRDETVVAELPVRVLMEASLEELESHTEPCPPSPEEPPTPTATPEAAVEEEPEPETLPESDEAIALVRDYVSALSEGRLEEAYALLHPTYQASHPYERWSLGYASVTEIEIRTIESALIDDDTDEVVAELALTREIGNRISHTDWTATYRVVATPGDSPYQRAIIDVRMRPLGVG
jgi:hypothetical protein